MGDPPLPPTPEALSVSEAMPKQLKNSGGTSLTLTGTGFQTGATVTIAGVPAQDVVVVSSTTITLKSPLKAATCGLVPIEVTNPGGHSSRPVPDNAIYRLGAALAKVSTIEFPIEFNDATTAFFKRMGELTPGQEGQDMRDAASGENAARCCCGSVPGCARYWLSNRRAVSI